MARRWVEVRRALAFAILCSSMVALGEVHIKSRDSGVRLLNRTSRGKSRQAPRSHLILDFAETPTAETARKLTARGMRVVAYLPVTGVIVGVEGEPDLRGLNVNGFDAMQPEDKLSPELARASGRSARHYFVVEFHADVPWEERRALVTETGLAIRDHQDLVAEHMLVRGTLEQAHALAEWDEVAYVFPASGELATGLPLIGCVGAAAEAGQVGQLTQRIGEGWDGPGLGAASLTYSLQALTGKIPAEQAQQEIQRAMAMWSQVVKVNFARTASTGASRNINILFGARDHGDNYAFDGPGRVLAHTFYPAPPNPEPIAGDLHFDDEENWNVGADVDLFSVALHELGHALGLGHSDVPNAVMYPYYRRATALTPEDIGAIRLLYGAMPDESVPAPLALSITTPSSGSTTSAATTSITGTVTGANGTPQVTWSNPRGGSGSATVTENGSGNYLWQVSSVTLSLGDNQIALNVADGANRTANAVVAVRRITEAAAPPAPTPIPVPPPPPAARLTLAVTAPAENSAVTKNPIMAYGTLSGGVGQLSVRWSSDRGFSGTATVTATNDGKYRWEVNPLAVQAGTNTFTITAADAAGATSLRSFAVEYTVPSAGNNPTGDNRPPQITLLAPTSPFLMTPAYAIAVRGSATDASGIAEVRWECSCGSRGVAQGTTQWLIPSISLQRGYHTIKVTAKDTAGLEGSARFAVFRY
ncbi:MAG: matrixin family metalloprotease [Acidobacteria bacterium]|nr:matrixin family metalloprotease [Acidobacteriota bacterium]